jgi:hypothetical protein
MAFDDGWTCRACWKPNRPQDELCYRCKTPRDADESEVEARRAAAAARADAPEKVPDLLVALPVVIFRGYSRVWIRGGLGVLGILALLAFGGVTDVGYLLLTGGLGAGLVAIGFVAREVSESMRDRELWAFAAGVAMSVVAVIGSVMAVRNPRARAGEPRCHPMGQRDRVRRSGRRRRRWPLPPDHATRSGGVTGRGRGKSVSLRPNLR